MKYNRSTKLSACWIFALGMIVSGCGDDEPDPGGPGEGLEQEVISLVTLTFQAEGEADSVEVTWDDADGPGGDDPVIDNITVAPNTTYTLSIKLTNTLAEPEEDITEEVMEEAEDHLLIFTSDDEDLVSVEYADTESTYVEDQEGEDYPVGLESTVTTGEAGETKLTVQLLHLPGLKTGDEAENLENGEDDINIEFTVLIEDAS